MKTLYVGDNCTNCTAAKDYIKYANLDIKIVHIDSEEFSNINEVVRGIPTLITYENGKEVERQVGLIDFTK